MTTPHGDVETPAFMPVGTQGAVKAMTVRDAGGRRRARSSSATPITCGCGPAPSSSPAAAACTLHRLAAADPHRQRRLPGVQPGGAAHGRGAGRGLPIASRRQRACCSRRSAPSTSRRGSAPTSRWCSTSARRIRRPARRSAPSLALTHAMGAALPGPASRRCAAAAPERCARTNAGQAQFGIVQGGIFTGPARRERRASRRGRTSTAMPSAA